MKIEARMTRLEQIVELHLEQSGNIRTDLAWLKKSFWALAGAGITFNITLIAGLLLYLLKAK